MSKFDDAFDDNYKAMYAKMHEPYRKYEIKWNKGESFADALVRSELTIHDLQELHLELTLLLNRRGPIHCDSYGDLSEAMRMIRYAAYEVPGIGWIDGYGYKHISTKKQYRRIDEAIVEAIERKLSE